MENVRIDKGVKRPKNKHAPPTIIRTSNTLIPADLQPQQVLERYLSEETTSQIAQSYGVSRKALVRWLVDTVPQEWRKVQTVRALCKKESGDEGIEVACDALSLARAREMLRSGQWDLERLDATTYGLQTKVTVEHTGDLGDRLRRAKERVIEGEYTPVTPDQPKPLEDRG